jgi:hypothetical protein
VRKAVDAVDARKSTMGRPKLYKDLVTSVIGKPKTTPRARKKKRANNSPKYDITVRGRRMPGSGWAGKGQR